MWRGCGAASWGSHTVGEAWEVGFFSGGGGAETFFSGRGGGGSFSIGEGSGFLPDGDQNYIYQLIKLQFLSL